MPFSAALKDVYLGIVCTEMITGTLQEWLSAERQSEKRRDQVQGKILSILGRYQEGELNSRKKNWKKI